MKYEHSDGRSGQKETDKNGNVRQSRDESNAPRGAYDDKARKSDGRKPGIRERLVLFFRHRTFRLWQGALYVLAFSVALTFLGFSGNHGGEHADVSVLFPLFLLNFLPVFFTSLFLYFLSGSHRISMLLSYGFYSLIYVVNRIKITYRNEPFYLTDFKLGIEGIAISKGQNYAPDGALLLRLGLVFLLFAAALYFKHEKIRWRVRLCVLVILVLFSGLLYRRVYENTSLYSGFKIVGNVYSDKNNAEGKGIVYYLLHSIKNLKVKVPAGYTASEFRDIERGTAFVPEVLPNILMIMGEAYDDLSDEDVFVFSDGIRPTSNFDRLAEDALATGRIVVSTFGGGTADTEFDVLTGCMTVECAPNRSYGFNSVLKETPSIARTLKSLGYHTRAFHPGYNFFYKRQSVYPRLGFDEVYFEDSVDPQILVSGYMQEQLTFDVYRKRLEEHLEKSDKPIFDYMVTIQNHGPYYRGKFTEEFHFDTKYPLSDLVIGCFEGYFQGVHEMDVEIGKLAAWMETREEPFVLIFYGDHLPSLHGGNQSYEEIGFNIWGAGFENEVHKFSTPYLILANKSYRDILKKERISEIRRRSDLLSANYLGGLVLQLVGADVFDDFYVNLNGLRLQFPVLSRSYAYSGERAVPREQLDDPAVRRYYRYQYYRIHDFKVRE